MSSVSTRITSIEQLRALLPKTAPEALGVEIVPVGIEINGSHIRSASDGHILAKATIIRRSSKLVVHNIEIAHEESGRALCLARVTNFYKAMQSV
jgi:uncharacterized protein (TIGR00369 family)